MRIGYLCCFVTFLQQATMSEIHITVEEFVDGAEDDGDDGDGGDDQALDIEV